MNLGAAGFWLYLPINQLRKNGPNYLDNTHRSGKGLKITQMCRFKPWVLSIFLLTKKMPCLIRNNHKFGERNTSCCVTKLGGPDHLDVSKDCEAVETSKQKKRRTPDFWGLIFPPQKLGEKLITYLGFACPRSPRVLIRRLGSNFNPSREIPVQLLRRKWKSHLPGDLELLDRNGFWWTKHPHRYLNVGQIITGRDLRHVKIAET